MPMAQSELTALLERIRPIAQEAGRAIRAVELEDADVRTKEDGSPLTRADTASDRIIATGLQALNAGLPVLSEEGDLTATSSGNWDVYWCVDPLDGTKEFIKGLPDYTVNIALIEAGVPVLGVVDIPAQQMTYWAARGSGAWKAAHGQAPARIAANTGATPRSAVVSRSHLDENTRQFLESLQITDAVPHGSSLKICAVADGTADIYPRFGPTSLWDTAAGCAVAREAGCRVVNLDATDLRYVPADGILVPQFLVCTASAFTETVAAEAARFAAST